MLPAVPLFVGPCIVDRPALTATRGTHSHWLAGLPDSLHVGNQTLRTTVVLSVADSLNFRDAISLYELPRCYLSLLHVDCRGAISLCEPESCTV